MAGLIEKEQQFIAGMTMNHALLDPKQLDKLRPARKFDLSRLPAMLRPVYNSG